MPSFRKWTASVAAAVTLVGCSNVHVKKVPVDKLVDGQDHHIKGFRYYLSRPYVVVKKRIVVMRNRWQTRLVLTSNRARLHDEQYALEGLAFLPGTRIHPLFDLAGRSLNPSEWTAPRPVQITDADLPGLPELGIVRTSLLQDQNLPAAGALPQLERPAPNPAGAIDALPGDAASALGPIADGQPGGTPPVGRPAERTAPNPAAAAGAAMAGEPAPPSLTENIQVVFLPDFEEQYAVSHSNFAAKGSYDMHFTDGWRLDAMRGNYNATEVPVRILQSVQKAIGAATEYQAQVIQTQKSQKAKETGSTKDRSETKETRFEVIQEFAVEPGIYRIQKSWERLPAALPDEMPQEYAFGLLADLGLPVTQSLLVNKTSVGGSK